MSRVGFFLVVLPFVTCLVVACGSANSGRQLHSITINAVGDCCETIFTATGTYSTAPSTVSPLPTSWSLGTPPDTYQLTTQPFAVICPLPNGNYLVTAMSPVNPNAPLTGTVSSTKIVVTTTHAICE